MFEVNGRKQFLLYLQDFSLEFDRFCDSSALLFRLRACLIFIPIEANLQMAVEFNLRQAT